MAVGGKLRVGSGRRTGNDLKIRVGTVNVRSLSGRSGLVEMIGRRCLEFSSLQDTRWKGGLPKRWVKWGFSGRDVMREWLGVPVLVAERWIEKVIEVRRVCDSIVLLRQLGIVFCVWYQCMHADRRMEKKVVLLCVEKGCFGYEIR
jgi:hypothetical protein